MIMKVATSKDNEGKINWTNLYASAIRNRLRRDLNLADIPDVEAARNNLGITGYIDNATENLSTDLKNYIDRLINELDTKLRNHIKIKAIDPIEEHDIRITNLEETMLSSDDVYSYISLFWDSNIPGVKQEAKDYSDANLDKAKEYVDALIKAIRESLANSTGNINAALQGALLRIDTLETDVSSLKERVTKLDNSTNGRVTLLDDATNGRVTKLEQRMTVIDGDKVPKDGRMTKAEDAIGALQENVKDLNDPTLDSSGRPQGRVPILEVDMERLKKDVRNLDSTEKAANNRYVGKVPNLEKDLETLSGRVTVLDKTNEPKGRVTKLEERMLALDSKEKSNKGRVTKLEEAVDKLEKAVAALDKLPVGTIIAYNGNVTIPEKWHICDGSTVNGIKLVNLTNRFAIGYGSLGAVGTELEPTLPNITGTMTSEAQFQGSYTKDAPKGISGAFVIEHDRPSIGKHLIPHDDEQSGLQVLGFDASRVSKIYKNGNDVTVRPPSTVICYIQKIKA